MILHKKAIFLALLAAALYGMSAPFSKLLLGDIEPLLLAALLYLGAAFGMVLIMLARKITGWTGEEGVLTLKDLPYVIAMVILDIIAPIALLYGLSVSSAATVSLLNNFEIVATSLIALLIFKENIGRQMWYAIFLITLATLLLSLDLNQAIILNHGAILVLLATLAWGLENNCTKKLSIKDPLMVVLIKGTGSGLGALLLAIIFGELSATFITVVLGLLVGSLSYGMSIFFYIHAQRELGAARTSAYYAIAPFIGVIITLVMFKEFPSVQFYIALFMMMVGSYFAVTQRNNHQHHHKPIVHEHAHSHDDGHHTHDNSSVTHSHVHRHNAIDHQHEHTPDSHHNHRH